MKILKERRKYKFVCRKKKSNLAMMLNIKKINHKMKDKKKA